MEEVNMNKKIRTGITKITINECTYNNSSIEPTLINFFYGRNGTGKSTLARAIYEKREIDWNGQNEDARSGNENAENTEVMIFDEKYINETVKKYNGIQGVFTLAEDAKNREELDSKIEERKKLNNELREARKRAKNLANAKRGVNQECQDETWERTRLVRDDIFSRMKFSGAKKNLFNDLLQCKPIQSNIEDLKPKYRILYENVQARYDLYQTVDHIKFPSSEIIYKPIISGSDKDFAKFVKALGNLSWVREGYDKYLHNSGGKCPFCQREGLDTSSLKDLFDEQYDEDVKKLQDFVADYKDAYKQITSIHETNKKNPYSLKHELIMLYRQEFDDFRKAADKNLSLLNEKLQDLSLELNDFLDLSLHLKRISECIQKINAEITEYMKLVMDNQREKELFYNTVCSLMSFNCQDIFAKYKKAQDDIAEKICANKRDIDAKEKAILALTARIDELSQVNTTTVKVMQYINDTLKNIGFRGFSFREKHEEPYLYEIVRNDGETVKDSLSEGERNFIAFLYFYYTVMYTTKKDGVVNNKIVIIDDPVSSLDSQSLFYVAVLTREMIRVCYNNYELYEDDEDGRKNFIKQIFCMTHNPAFFYDISHNMLPQYECVSFFKITKKDDNYTDVEETVDGEGINGIVCNKSPVKNHYEALWTDFHSTNNKNYLMSIARQIIYYHFIRIGGYNPSEFRSILNNAAQRTENGQNTNIYRIADAMIGLLDVGITSFNDGIFFDEAAYSLNEMRNAFEMIFSAMNQSQHYEMMTERATM